MYGAGEPDRRNLPPLGEAVMYMQIAATRQRRTYGGVFNANRVKRLPAIQSSDPELVKLEHRGIPRLDERHVCWTPGIPKQRGPESTLRRFYFRRDVELQLYGYTHGCIGWNAARDGRVAKPHSLDCRDWIEHAIISEESDETRRRNEVSQRRRDAVGVPLEPRLGRADKLPPGGVAGERAPPEWPGTETLMEEQASGSTDLPMRIAVGKRTTEVTESDGCQNWKGSKSWKNRG